MGGDSQRGASQGYLGLRYHFFKLREPLFQFVEFGAPFGEGRFKTFHDLLWRTAAKRLILKAPLLRGDVFREPVDLLAQARYFLGNVCARVISDLELVSCA